MEFTIQYFGPFDQMLYVETVDVKELDNALERARAVINSPKIHNPLDMSFLTEGGARWLVATSPARPPRHQPIGDGFDARRRRAPAWRRDQPKKFLQIITIYWLPYRDRLVSREVGAARKD
jgi:hypothetical protein